MINKKRAPNNRTIVIEENEINALKKNVKTLSSKASVENIGSTIINQDFFEAVNYLPEKFVDLLIIDPPYNLSKKFNSVTFSRVSLKEYEIWFDHVISKLLPALKPTSSIYVCSDWYSSNMVFNVLQKYFIIRNRITWERDKGRGAKRNWKNNSEDIWFCTFGDDYYFDIDSVKIKRKVLAPYKTESGEPKDWHVSGDKKFRVTHPSNLWNDISVPFWSMPENTDHPTQKPEKLIAKIILASSKENDFVFDPFAGSGTTLVTSKKLNRNFTGIETDEYFALLTSKRLNIAETNKSIQGFSDGIFWERNSSKV